MRRASSFLEEMKNASKASTSTSSGTSSSAIPKDECCCHYEEYIRATFRFSGARF